jgi:hypothetical protein
MYYYGLLELDEVGYGWSWVFADFVVDWEPFDSLEKVVWASATHFDCFYYEKMRSRKNIELEAWANGHYGKVTPSRSCQTPTLSSFWCLVISFHRQAHRKIQDRSKSFGSLFTETSKPTPGHL